MTSPTPDSTDVPDLSETHVLLDFPNFGKVWAIKDIADYYDKMLSWHTRQQAALLRRLLEQKKQYNMAVPREQLLHLSAIPASVLEAELAKLEGRES